MKYKILILVLIFSISLFAKSDIPIIDAAGKGDINKVRTLIKEGANINQQDRGECINRSCRGRTYRDCKIIDRK